MLRNTSLEFLHLLYLLANGGTPWNDDQFIKIPLPTQNIADITNLKGI
jgi:hypothetical protein